ncbi:hypothetical protein RDWZM_005520 [Blomia tropicalis]|uniref:B30.2/SPRY domain-containing protein n=1 Tax=Blomia tropicalis TaxID=40697 RepID=A0A9Q0M464_BLOTA|nr:hypothetical protein RDWZM_005520 [Blomia tropicalis]
MYSPFTDWSAQGSPIFSPNVVSQSTHLNRNSVPVFITPDGTIFYADESSLQSQTQSQQAAASLSTNYHSHNNRNPESFVSNAYQLPIVESQRNQSDQLINLYYGSPSTSFNTSSPSTSSRISSSLHGHSSQTAYGQVHTNGSHHTTQRNRNSNSAKSIGISTSNRSIHSNLKLKSRRRAPISYKAIHSLCLCSIAHRFPHTIEHHQRLKLDNLAAINSTPFLGANLINAMGQKVSHPFANKTHSHNVIREQSSCSSTITAVHQATANSNTLPRRPDLSSTQLHREPERPARLDLLLDMEPASESVQKEHGWNENDRSLNIFVLEDDPRVVHRHPVAQSTDCVRGRVGYKSGLHVWEIKWPLRQRGTHAVVGVATADAALHSNGYLPLVGSTAKSWGWDLGRNVLFHDLKLNPADHTNVQYYTYGQVYEHQFGYNFVAPETFLVVLDMDQGTLSFMANGQYLGVAFEGLKGQTLYPIISSVWGHCEITMRYINGLKPEPSPLKDIARRAIRRQLGPNRLNSIQSELVIPEVLKKYLLYHDQPHNQAWKPL